MGRERRRFEVRLTQGAEEDLEALHVYMTVHRSPAEADALLDAIAERVGTLETFPERGAVPRELAALGIRDFRQLLQSPYRIIYQVIGKTVVVSVIADGRRNIGSLLEQRLLGNRGL